MQARIRIFVGAYGSGKTEVALHHAFSLAGGEREVAIADLDLVNPFFRSRELRVALEESGVTLVAPRGELAQADLPIVTSGVRGFLEEPDVTMVLDVGGDDAGSRAMSQFRPFVEEGDYEMLMVLNQRRPFTDTVEGIGASIARVEMASRFKVTGVVSNTNLGAKTSPRVVEEGHSVICRAAQELGLPVVALAVLDPLANELDQSRVGDVPLWRLQRRLHTPWEDDPLRHAPRGDRRTVMMALEMASREPEPEPEEETRHGEQDRG